MNEITGTEAVKGRKRIFPAFTYEGRETALIEKKNTVQQQEMEKWMNEYKSLCGEVREQIKKYKQLNRELTMSIIECKREKDRIKKKYQEMMGQ